LIAIFYSTTKRTQFLGGFCDGGTPVLIPNTAAKSICADDSRKAKVGSRQDIVFFLFLRQNKIDGGKVNKKISDIHLFFLYIKSF
jgi:hypothetical protein